MFMEFLREHKTRRAMNSSGFALVDLFIISLLSHAGQSLCRFLAP